MPSSQDTSKVKRGTSVHKPRKKEFKGKRAIRACDSCRRLKTRCILSPVPNEFYCLRCESLKIHCSFQDMLGRPESRTEETDSADPETLKVLIKHGYGGKDAEITSKLLHTINNNVHKVLQILEKSPSPSGLPEPAGPAETAGQTALSSPTELLPPPHSIPKVDYNMAGSEKVESDTRSVERSSPDLSSSLLTTESYHVLPYLTSPYVLFSQLVPGENLPISVRPICKKTKGPAVDDLVTINLITLPEALMLVEVFRQHYGIWCSFPVEQSIEELVENIRSNNGSLLLTTTCVLALRYTDRHHDLKTRVYKNLLYKLKSDLELSLKLIPQTIEVLQAIVILSFYASSFSSDILSLDAWYLSGIGLQQYITMNVRGSLQTALDQDKKFLEDESSEIRAFTSFRIWNHLCLVHLTHCVLSGRMCIVDEIRLDLCRRVLQMPKATNFDGRMVGEIALELILYNFMQQCQSGGSTVPGDPTNTLEDVKEDLKDWLEEWNYLFTQPITQFLEFAYHYGYSMIIYSWHHRLYRTENEDIGKSKFNIDLHQGSGKTLVGSCLNAIYPVERIIASMPPETQLEMLLHSHKALHEMVKTEFNIFKYLSDQIFFGSVLLSLMCLEISSSLRKTDKDFLNDDKLQEILMEIKTFSVRLQKIREGELKSFWVEEVDLKIPSVILQYHKSIENSLQSKFPNFESPVI